MKGKIEDILKIKYEEIKVPEHFFEINFEKLDQNDTSDKMQ